MKMNREIQDISAGITVTQRKRNKARDEDYRKHRSVTPIESNSIKEITSSILTRFKSEKAKGGEISNSLTPAKETGKQKSPSGSKEKELLETGKVKTREESKEKERSRSRNTRQSQSP